MKKWHITEGYAVSLIKDDIDTDQLLPKQFMKLVDKNNFGKYLFYNWRIQDKDFVLNHWSDNQPSILVTGENFGCGSSREHAVWALADYGFKVIIGKSFGDIFSFNAGKNGLALIALDEISLLKIGNWLKDNLLKNVKVDLIEKCISFGETTINFQMNDAFRNRIIHGLDDIDETISEQNRIDLFMESYNSKLPFLLLE